MKVYFHKNIQNSLCYRNRYRWIRLVGCLSFRLENASQMDSLKNIMNKQFGALVFENEIKFKFSDACRRGSFSVVVK